MSDFYFSNEAHFNSVLTNIIVDGKECLHVIADFDRTLTKAYVEGKFKSSLEAIFDEQDFLWNEFTAKTREYFEKYFPIEIDPKITLEEKKKIMHEWWSNKFWLMLKYWLTKDMIKEAMKSDKIIFRSWSDCFFDLLTNNNIPLLIFSASGLWQDGVGYCLENKNKLSENISIISNSFLRDKHGKVLGIKDPIIHSFNKGEAAVFDLPIYNKIKERKNIILLGDSLGDADMAQGFNYKNIIKIWFLNHDTPENRKQFQEKFDLIILNDWPMDEINVILKQICR